MIKIKLVNKTFSLLLLLAIVYTVYFYEGANMTVGQLKAENIHLKGSADCFLRPDEDEISPTEIKVHATSQAILYSALPASTIKGLANNPMVFGISSGAGVLCGVTYRFFQEAAFPSKVSYLKDWKDWCVHTAGLNYLAKGSFALIRISLAVTNGVLTHYYPGSLNSIVEGVIAGSLLGYEAGGLVVQSVTKKKEGADETRPLL